MKKTKATSVMICAVTACMLLTTACSSGTGAQATAQPSPTAQPATQTPATVQPATQAPAAPTAQDPLALEIMIGYDGVEFPQPGNAAQTAIEEYTNTKLDITAYPGSTLHSMLPTMIASDDLPTAVAFGGSQLSASYMIDAMTSDVFWDVTDYIDRFPNIAELSDDIFATYRMNGRNYGLPKERGIARDAVGYRNDWLENLGLEEPETVQDLYDIILAFTKNDPDQNGQNDTYGTAGHYPVNRFCVWLGGPNEWLYKDGQMIKKQFTPEHQQAIDMVRELYSEGALHPEYSIHSRSQIEALWTEGRAGTLFNVNNFAQFAMAEDDVDIRVKGVFSDEDGKYSIGGSGHNGVISFSKTATPDEETFLRIMQFFDDLGDQEMCNLLAIGFEGVHYNIVNGIGVPVIEKLDDLNQQIYMPYAAPMAVVYPDLKTIPMERPYLQARITEVLEENEPYAVTDPTTGLISQTNNEKGADLTTFINDTDTQYIMGVLTKDQYLAEIDKWLDQGGDKICEEFAAAYKERMGIK